jgi:hypothetical protein
LAAGTRIAAYVASLDDPRRAREQETSNWKNMGGMRAMKKVLTMMMVVAVAALVFAPLAFAAEVQGKIRAVDQSGRWVTLEEGLQLMIPTGVKVDRKALQPGAEVKASYETQGNENIVTTIEVRPAATK